MKLFQGGLPSKIIFENNFKNLTCWMYRFIDSNHHQNNFWLEIVLMGYPPLNNFDENTLTAKKYFKIILVFDLVLIRWQIPPLDEGMSYTQVSAGCVHTALLRSDGNVVTLGGNDVEQCDIPSCAMLDLQKWLIIVLVFFLDWCVANPTTQMNSTSCFMCAPW